VIDTCEVIRLKAGLTKHHPPEHFGTRTDHLCARSGVYRQEGLDFWHFQEDKPEDPQCRWLRYYARFKPKYWKPSIGLCAVFMAKDRLDPKEIAVIGFDRVLYPEDGISYKWNHTKNNPFPWFHDQRSERECIHSLGIRIIDLAREHAEIP
jgi:hypothetical protein